METILQNFDLTAYNTFGIKTGADLFASVDSLAVLERILEQHDRESLPILILGGGSNVLFSGWFRGLVLRPGFTGSEVLEENNKEVLVRVGAGENWDCWVKRSLDQGWFGLENLSLIPGSVGAAPIQNIGAYGVEVAERVEWVEVFNMDRRKAERLLHRECGFGYRNSIFKSGTGDRYMITHVVFRLSRATSLMLDYGSVRERFMKTGGKTPVDLRNTIMDIRNEKLPSPADVANAGSFFKNPVVERQVYNRIRSGSPGMPEFRAGEKRVKIPAAWLIDRAGWKGKRLGRVGTWPSQPLVVVNYGGASGSEILKFSELIREDVERKFGIRLEREVTVI